MMFLTCSSIYKANCYEICSPTNKRQNDDVLYNSVTVNVYDCSNTIIPRNETCTMVKQNIYLPKDKEVDINYNIYGYPVKAKFFGRNLCVANPQIYRDSTDVNRTDNSNIDDCDIDCEDMFTKTDGSGWDDQDGTVWAGYERMTKCDNFGDCVESSSKYLKFVKTTNSAGSHANSINSSQAEFIQMMMLVLCSSFTLLNLAINQ